MSIDYTLDPGDVFHIPALQDGIAYLDERPDWILRPVTGATIRMFSESEDAGLQAQMAQKCAAEQSWELSPVFEVRASPVLLRDAEFARGLVRLSDRILLSGAAGSRARVSYQQKNKSPAQFEALLKFFRQSRNTGPRKIGVYRGDISQTDIALELRNGFNYYHFTTETLGSLCHYQTDRSAGTIRIHLPGKQIKPFMQRFVADLFPEIADRVTFTSAKTRYAAVRSVFSHHHYLYTMNDPSVEDVLGAAENDPRWPVSARNPAHFGRAAKFTFDSSLRMLRDTALQRINQARVKTLPKRVWLGRDEDSDGARARGLAGHRPLMEALTARGFETIAFESLSPLEQIEAMHAADIVISPHGAGLANMIYAKTGARVVEIGTRQTQLHRWGDFLKCAHVSRCNYDVVFADVLGLDDLGKVPAMSDGHRGIHIGKRATDRLIAIVDEEIGQMQGSGETG